MTIRRAWILAAALLGVSFSLFLLIHQARTSGGISSFPLDDPWIHLTYARNLHDHHSFSYFPGERPTAGSTSPLYTLILALGFSVTRDEKALSFALGLLFQAAFLVTAGLWARARLGSDLLAALAVCLLGLDANLGILSVAGMETSLFLFLLALCFWARATTRPAVLGIALGLAVWVRPDAAILGCVLGIDALLGFNPRAARRATLLRWCVPLLLLLAGYLVWNEATGGTLLPNTFAAKRAYYAPTPRSVFLSRDVRSLFLAQGWVVLLPFALVGLGLELRSLYRREPGRLRAEGGFSLALILSYLVLLPFAHRFGRYLVPALPSFAVLALGGLQHASGWIRRPGPAFALGLVSIAAIGLHLPGLARADAQYRELVRYHWARHERCGRWLAEHTPPDAVIATHDVGAIAYYSRRRVVDTVGLIQPDAISHLHQKDYVPFLNEFFAREKVTHLACLRNWLEVTNVAPIYLAEDAPEFLEVYPWIPGRTHLSSETVSFLGAEAERRLRQGDTEGCLAVLERSLALDAENSHTWLVVGTLLEAKAMYPDAEHCYRQAIALFPESRDTLFRLGVCLGAQGRQGEALVFARQLLALDPAYRGIAELVAALERP